MASPFDFLLAPGADPFSPIPPAMPQSMIPPQQSIPGLDPVGKMGTPFPAGQMAPSQATPANPWQTSVTQAPQQPELLPPAPGNPFVQGTPPQGEDSILGVPWSTVERALETIESGGRWDKLGPTITNPNSRYRGDRAYGRYQFMGRDIPELTRQFYGQSLTPQEFLQNPQAQTAVFRGRFGQHARQYGSLVDAAQAHFAGPGSFNRPDRGASLTDAQAGFRGTTVANYRRMFASGLSRAAGLPAEPTGPQFNQLDIGSNLAEATGQPQMQAFGQTPQAAPAPISDQAVAIAPGLAQFGAQQPAQAAAGALPFGDLWADMGARPSGLTQLASYQAQAPSAQQLAAARIFQRGQELRAENQNATPDQIARILIRDPVWGQNAISLGTQASAALQAAVSPAAPITSQAVSPGQQIFQQQGGVITPTGQGLPPSLPDPVRTAQWVQSLPPEHQQQAMSILSQLRAGGPSDREQAIARIQASEAAGQQASIHDLQLAGYLRQEPVVNEYGQVTGFRTVNTYQPQTRPRYPGAGQPEALAPSGQPGMSGVSPPASGISGAMPIPAGTPGTSFSQAPWQPGQTIPPETIDALSGGLFGAPGSQVPQIPQTQQAPQRPRPISTEPQIIGRIGNRDLLDIPDLSLNTSILERPEYMVLGAGPASAFRGVWGRIVGNLPGMQASEEETINRQILLQQFRSAYATYRQGTRLAGEHAETMAEIPTAIEIFTNPLRAVNQFISVREGLVRDLQLARQQSQDQSLAEQTRKNASEQVAKIQNLLLRLPSTQGLIEIANGLRTGQELPSTGLPDVSEMLGQAQEGANRAITGDTGKTQIPADISGYSIPELQRLSKRPNLPQADAARLAEALRNRMQAGR